MTHSQARTIAIRAIEAQIKALAIDANMHERLGATYPRAIQASAERARLRAAIAKLQEVEQERIAL